jgi:hypothetical protein
VADAIQSLFDIFKPFLDILGLLHFDFQHHRLTFHNEKALADWHLGGLRWNAKNETA